MNFLNRAVIKFASAITGIKLDRLNDFIGGGVQSESGVEITPETAVSSTSVLACGRVLSESIAQTPLHLIAEKNRIKEHAKKERLYQVGHDSPNPEMTAFEFKEIAVSQMIFWGNFYAEIERDGFANVKNLWPLASKKVQPERLESGEIVYHVYINGKRVTLPAYKVLHIRGWSPTGLVGEGLINYGKEAIGAALIQQSYVSRFFKKNGVQRGWIHVPKGAAIGDKDKFRQEWDSLTNADRTAILEGDIEWKSCGVSPSDSQLIEGRTFQAAEVARIFRVPLHMIGELSRATFSNIEQQAIEFVNFTLMPWLVRIEQRLNMQLIPSYSQGEKYFKFNVNAFLRGDMQAQSKFLRELFYIGGISPNEIREFLDMNPRENGDEYYVPVNMVPSGDDYVLAPTKAAKGTGNETAVSK